MENPSVFSSFIMRSHKINFDSSVFFAYSIFLISDKIWLVSSAYSMFRLISSLMYHCISMIISNVCTHAVTLRNTGICFKSITLFISAPDLSWVLVRKFMMFSSSGSKTFASSCISGDRVMVLKAFDMCGDDPTADLHNIFKTLRIYVEKNEPHYKHTTCISRGFSRGIRVVCMKGWFCNNAVIVWEVVCQGRLLLITLANNQKQSLKGVL